MYDGKVSCLDAISIRTVPWVPEAFLARFPVAAYVLYCEKKTSGTQGIRTEKPVRIFCQMEFIYSSQIIANWFMSDLANQ